MTGGTLIASNTLTLRVLTLAHAGEYSCEAVNSVGEGRSPPIFVQMKCKYMVSRLLLLLQFRFSQRRLFCRIDAPRCRAGYERREVTAGRHETVSLRCEVDAVPKDAVRFSWTYNGTRGDVLPMPNSRARNNGLVSVLEYTPTTDTDFGTLACWASNSVGRQRTPCVFNIVPGSTCPWKLITRTNSTKACRRNFDVFACSSTFYLKSSRGKGTKLPSEAKFNVFRR